MTKREKVKKINAEIKEARKVRDSFLATLREETDKDYRYGLSLNIERCDQIIHELVAREINSNDNRSTMVRPPRRHHA